MNNNNNNNNNNNDNNKNNNDSNFIGDVYAAFVRVDECDPPSHKSTCELLSFTDHRHLSPSSSDITSPWIDVEADFTWLRLIFSSSK